MGKKIVFKNFFFVAIIIDVLTVLAIIILKDFLPPRVPLFYGRPVGETQLTSTLGFLIAPISAFLLTLVNLIVSFWVKDYFLKKVIAVSTLTISILTAITVFKIILLVGFF